MASLLDFIGTYLEQVHGCLNEVDGARVADIAYSIFEAFRQNKRVYIFGNGGSSATASHFACDLAKGTAHSTSPHLPVICLNDNMALMTAIANDISYTAVFREQLANFLEEGDVVIAISASGNSSNILEAVEYAKKQRAVTIGICGFGGGRLSRIADKALVFSSHDYGQVEDGQMVLAHLISRVVHHILECKGLESEKLTRLV